MTDKSVASEAKTGKKMKSGAFLTGVPQKTGQEEPIAEAV